MALQALFAVYLPMNIYLPFGLFSFRSTPLVRSNTPTKPAELPLKKAEKL
jgi:hypothetical protein